jgi:hypothetical protein
MILLVATDKTPATTALRRGATSGFEESLVCCPACPLRLSPPETKEILTSLRFVKRYFIFGFYRPLPTLRSLAGRHQSCQPAAGATQAVTPAADLPSSCHYAGDNQMV